MEQERFLAKYLHDQGNHTLMVLVSAFMKPSDTGMQGNDILSKGTLETGLIFSTIKAVAVA